MSRGWIPRGPLKGPLSNVGGKAEEGRSGSEPGALEGGVTCHSHPVFSIFPFFSSNDSSKAIILLSGDLYKFFSSFFVFNTLFKSEHICLRMCRFPVCVSVVLPFTKLTSPDMDLTASSMMLVITMCVFLICLVIILLTQAASEHFILAFTTRLLDTEEQLS